MLKILALIVSLGMWSSANATTLPDTVIPVTSKTSSPIKSVPVTTTAAATTSVPTSAATTTPATADATKIADNQQPLDIKAIDSVMGIRGKMDEQTKTYRVIFPRNDLNIILNGVKLTPSMGLTSWAAFQKTNNTTTMKADVVVTENQANTILSLALDNKLSVIALHNHLLWESPRVMFIHVEGAGDEKTLALAIKKVFAKTEDTNDEASDFPLAAIDATDTTLNTAKIDNILGAKGALKEDGSYLIHVAKVSDSDTNAVKNKIINSTATFAGSDSEAVVDGDISMRAVDLQAVLKTLHKAGIAVVALHEHESNNADTRMVYLHYFGVGQTKVLANGLRGALDAAKANDTANNTPSVALLKVPVPVNTNTPAKTQTATSAKPQPTQAAVTPEQKAAPFTLVQSPTSAQPAKNISALKPATSVTTPVQTSSVQAPVKSGVKAPELVAFVKQLPPPVKTPVPVAVTKVAPAQNTASKSVPLTLNKSVQQVAVNKSAAKNSVKTVTVAAANKAGKQSGTVKPVVALSKVITPATIGKPALTSKSVTSVAVHKPAPIKPATHVASKKPAPASKPVTQAFAKKPEQTAKPAKQLANNKPAPVAKPVTQATSKPSVPATPVTQQVASKSKSASPVMLKFQQTLVQVNPADASARAKTSTHIAKVTPKSRTVVAQTKKHIPQMRSAADSKRLADAAAASAAKRMQS